MAPCSACAADKRPPLPEGLTPHSGRRTFASVLNALGESPFTVMQELGHTDPALALRVYAQAMRRDESETARLRALVDSAHWADMGRRGANGDAPDAAMGSKSVSLQV
jgi:integrase